jgi:hypothetical protein
MTGDPWTDNWIVAGIAVAIALPAIYLALWVMVVIRDRAEDRRRVEPRLSYVGDKPMQDPIRPRLPEPPMRRRVLHLVAGGAVLWLIVIAAVATALLIFHLMAPNAG